MLAATGLAGNVFAGRGSSRHSLRTGLGRYIGGLRDRERFALLEPRRVDAELAARAERGERVKLSL